MSKESERRQMPRQRMQAFAALEATGRHNNDQAFSAVTDISRNGIGLRTGQPPLQGQRVVVRLAIGEEIHTLSATATRVEQRGSNMWHVGLDLTACSDDAIAFLDDYLAALAAANKDESGREH